MNSIDIIFVIFLCIFFFVGLLKGFFREIFGLIGVLGGIVGAIIGFGPLSNLAAEYLPGIPGFIWPFITFLIIFIAIYIACRLLANFLSHLSEKAFLGWLNRLLGGVVGAVKAAIIISLILLLIGFLPVSGALHKVKEESKLYQPIQNLIPSLYNWGMRVSRSSTDFEAEIKEKFNNAKIKLTDEMIKYLFDQSESVENEIQ